MGKVRHRKRSRRLSGYNLNLSIGRECGGSSSDNGDGSVGSPNDPPRHRLTGTLVRAALAGKNPIEEEDSWEVRAHKIRFPNDWNQLHQTLLSIRKLLAAKHPPIPEVIDAGMIPDFIALLKDATQELIPAEAAWCLCNVTAGDHAQTEVVVNHGAIPIFVELIGSRRSDISEQALWALGNIAGDCGLFRDRVLEEPIIPAILGYKTNEQELTAQRICVWTCGNLWKHHPMPSLELIGPLVPFVVQCLCCPVYDDRGALLDALRALELLCAGAHSGEHDRRIHFVSECAQLAPRLLELLKKKDMPDRITEGALRVVSSILSCAGQPREVMIQNGALNPFRELLVHPTPHIRREACRVLGNITACNQGDIASERSYKKDNLPRPAMYVLASPDHPLVVTRIKAMIHEGLVQSLVQVLAHDRDLEVGREAFIALTNALISGSEDQVAHIIGAGVMDPFANLLTLRDLWTVAKTLEAIEHILSMGGSLADEFVFVLESDISTETRANRFCESIEDAGVVESVEHLKNHKNKDIRAQALRIAGYFQGERNTKKREVESGKSYPLRSSVNMEPVSPKEYIYTFKPRVK
eukprot:GEMP01023879.1.p1 GENE.GEMP01023879.1~~GEMP01023879.1.p1  ORF type:complete len:583 (+),score=132.92 GEMP01023879.1:149-1897(+)